jgi:hypothetical protein
MNYNNSAGQVQSIILDFGGSGTAYAEYTGYAGIGGGTTDSFIIVSRNAAGTDTIRARNEVALSDKNEVCNDIDDTREWFLGAEQSSGGGFGGATSNGYIWVGFGTKLTDSELLTYQNIVNTFQTSIGRNTY